MSLYGSAVALPNHIAFKTCASQFNEHPQCSADLLNICLQDPEMRDKIFKDFEIRYRRGIDLRTSQTQQQITRNQFKAADRWIGLVYPDRDFADPIDLEQSFSWLASIGMIESARALIDENQAEPPADYDRSIAIAKMISTGDSVEFLGIFSDEFVSDFKSSPPSTGKGLYILGLISNVGHSLERGDAETAAALMNIVFKLSVAAGASDIENVMSGKDLDKLAIFFKGGRNTTLEFAELLENKTLAARIYFFLPFYEERLRQFRSKQLRKKVEPSYMTPLKLAEARRFRDALALLSEPDAEWIQPSDALLKLRRELEVLPIWLTDDGIRCLQLQRVQVLISGSELR